MVPAPPIKWFIELKPKRNSFIIKVEWCKTGPIPIRRRGLSV